MYCDAATMQGVKMVSEEAICVIRLKPGQALAIVLLMSGCRTTSSSQFSQRLTNRFISEERMTHPLVQILDSSARLMSH